QLRLRGRRCLRSYRLQQDEKKADEVHRRSRVSRVRKNRSNGSTTPPSVRTATPSIASRRSKFFRSSRSARTRSEYVVRTLGLLVSPSKASPVSGSTSRAIALYR